MPAVKAAGEACEGEPHARFDGGREETDASQLTPRGARRLPAYPTATGGRAEICFRLYAPLSQQSSVTRKTLLSLPALQSGIRRERARTLLGHRSHRSASAAVCSAG
jgi:hypothetical protein